MNRNTKEIDVETLRELSTVMKFQQQLGKECEKSKKEQAIEEIYVEKVWQEIKEVIVEAAEQTIGYQPKPDMRGWFDVE